MNTNDARSGMFRHASVCLTCGGNLVILQCPNVDKQEAENRANGITVADTKSINP